MRSRAKFAHPIATVLAHRGDGAMQMNGMAELLTIAKYWQDWADPRSSCSCCTTTISTRSRGSSGRWRATRSSKRHRRSPTSTTPRTRELCGLQGIRVEQPDHIADGWKRAFSSSVPTVIDAHASPDVPPIPPHIKWKQTKAMMSALLTGDPDAAGIVRQAGKQSLLDLLPGRG